MCGFIGRINGKKRRGESKPLLAAGLKFLSRRGPDSSKQWKSQDGSIELLHARLAIVDTDSRAHQPITDPQREITVVFVGEIYNYPELRSEMPHYEFRTKSDTEVLLATYALRGIEGLKDLRGMYTACIVDEARGRIFMVRDPIGKKPLFLAQWDGDTLFGSSLLPLVRAHGGKVELDPEVRAHYWERAFVPSHKTVFRGATPVLPGEIIELNWDGEVIRRLRREPSPLRLYQGETHEEAIRTVEELLQISVRRRLGNNPTPTVLLSGGIDSTVVASMASRIINAAGLRLRTPLQALTLGSVLPGMNDEWYARYAARRLGLHLQFVRPSFDRMGESVMHAIDLQDEPLGMPSYFLQERMVHAASAYGRVLMTGDGGDEIFLGYGKPSEWVRDNITQNTEPLISSGPPLPSWFSEWGREVAGNTLIGHMFAKVDRASAEQGVEIRCPLLAYDLVTYIRSLPFEILTHNAQSKFLLKGQLANWPRWFLERPKLGFAYNLRWLWGIKRFEGLREAIDPRSLEAFGPMLPPSLRSHPLNWRTLDIFQNFEAAWRLMVWSRFLARFDDASKNLTASKRKAGSNNSRVCLITGSHVCSCPRLIKEADALHSAGSKVLVLGAPTVPKVWKIDEELERAKPWKIHSVKRFKISPLRRLVEAQEKFRARRAVIHGDCSADAIARAIAPWREEYLDHIGRFAPDLVIAHSVPALVVAYLAMRRFKTPYAFDMEDFHPGESLGGMKSISNQIAVRALSLCLPQAKYITAGSPQIAEAAMEAFDLGQVTPVLNSFPLESIQIDAPRDRRPGGLSLYWFSQTIGLDRGLRDLFEACSLLHGDFQIHLRGSLSRAVEAEIRILLERYHLGKKCFFHPWCSNAEVVSRAAEHDVGLALEATLPLNRDICITNKILVYSLAGLAIAATRTKGQQWVMSKAPEMGFLYEGENVRQLANGIQGWIDDPAKLIAAKQAARRAAEKLFHWEIESPKVLRLAEEAVLGVSPGV